VIIVLLRLVDLIETLLFLLILAHVILSYFMSPFHPIRRQIDRIVEPMLVPIRRVVPLVGMLDLSPLILLLLLQFAGYFLKRILFLFL
jgi:YggT family protein